MELLVIGDVHGCYHTFKKLVEQHWDRERQVLVQLGDLVDRGNFSPETLLYAMELQRQHPDRVKLLKGNHEYEIVLYYREGNANWFRQCGEETIAQFERRSLQLGTYAGWMAALPLYYETEHVFISHAGVSLDASEPLLESHSSSVLWNRGPLKNLGKLQLIGHTPCGSGRAEYDDRSNTLNLDTGAYEPGGLSAAVINGEGKIERILYCPTEPVDVQRELPSSRAK